MSLPAIIAAQIFCRRKKNKEQSVVQSFDDGGSRQAQTEIDRLMALTNQQQIDFQALMKTHIETEQKLEEFQKMIEEQKIDSFGKLTANQQRQFDAAVEVCRSLPPFPLPPNTIGFIGPTGMGKSYLINTISGKENLCPVGRNQTTMEITPYIVGNVVYIDIPGANQVISYLSADYIGVFKALKFIAVVVDRTIDQISNVCILLERLSIPFVVIFNKCDDGMNEVEGGIEGFKRIAKAEFSKHSFFRSMNIDRDVYFVSAKYPNTRGTDMPELIARIADRVGPEHFCPRSVPGPVEEESKTTDD